MRIQNYKKAALDAKRAENKPAALKYMQSIHLIIGMGFRFDSCKV